MKFREVSSSKEVKNAESLHETAREIHDEEARRFYSENLNEREELLNQIFRSYGLIK